MVKGLFTPLLLLVLRTRGATLGFFASAVAVAAMICLHTFSQGSVLSGEQRAHKFVGQFDASVEVLPSLLLGESLDPAEPDAILRSHGAQAISHHLRVRPLEGSPIGRNVGYVEGNVFDDLPAAYTLVSGVEPQHPGEVCVTTPLAGQSPVGTTLDFYGGALELQVTCEVTYEFSREDTEIVAAPGTWAQISETPEGAEQGSLYVSDARVTTLWSGGDVMSAYDDLVVRYMGDVQEFDSSAPLGNLMVKGALLSDPRTFNADRSPWSFLIPLLAVPALTGVLVGLTSGSLLARSVEVLHRVGIRRRRLYVLTAGLPGVMSLLGGAAGALVGLLAAWGVRLAAAAMATQPLGPVVGQVTVIGVALLLLVVGATLGGVLATARQRRALATDLSWVRLPSIPWPSPFALGVVAVLCAAGALWASTNRDSWSAVFLGVVLVGGALVVLTPVLVSWWARNRDRGAQSTLVAGRQITAGRGVWLMMLLFGVQALLATGGLTAVTSSVTAFNDSTAPSTPQNEVRVEIYEDEPGAMAGTLERVTTLLSDDLGHPRTYVYRLVASDTGGEGALFAVDSAADAAAFAGLDELSDEARAAFDRGEVLTRRDLPGSALRLELEAADGAGSRTVVQPTFLLDEADESLDNYAGVVRVDDAESAGLPLISDRVSFTGLSPDQVARAATAADRLGFSDGWLRTPRAPDVFELPRTIVVPAWIMAGVSLILALVYSAQTATSLRPLAAGLRSQGLSRGFTLSVGLRQLGMVILWPSLVGMAGGALGLIVMMALQDTGVPLHVPWPIVSVLLGGLLLSFALGTLLCQRGIRASERL